MGWLIVITLASLVPFEMVPHVGSSFRHTDKIVHCIFHLVNTTVFYLHFRKSGIPKILLKIAIGSFLYGMIIEALQYAMPYGRGFELKDMLANLTGILLASFLIKFILGASRA
ncbi:VanZ family protein [Robertkochia solimangrovi]|nr:VanZ family protein [Robertkochia solimangrovi]